MKGTVGNSCVEGGVDLRFSTVADAFDHYLVWSGWGDSSEAEALCSDSEEDSVFVDNGNLVTLDCESDR